MKALNVLCAQLTRDLFAIAKYLFGLSLGDSYIWFCSYQPTGLDRKTPEMAYNVSIWMVNHTIPYHTSSLTMTFTRLTSEVTHWVNNCNESRPDWKLLVRYYFHILVEKYTNKRVSKFLVTFHKNRHLHARKMHIYFHLVFIIWHKQQPLRLNFCSINVDKLLLCCIFSSV